MDYNEGRWLMRQWIDLIEAVDTITLYHGTCEDNAAALMRQGWTPYRAPMGGNMGRRCYLYLSTDPEDARWFSNQKGCDVVMAVRDIPVALLRVDPEDGSSDTVEDELTLPQRMKGLPGKVVLTRALGPDHFSRHAGSTVTVHEGMGNLDRTFYHVTLAENLPLIMEKGLVPSVGERSKKMSEREAVFLFASRGDAEDAVMNWLGDEFDDDDDDLALLEVTLPAEIAIYREHGIDWEVYVKDRIPPQCLHILERNL